MPKVRALTEERRIAEADSNRNMAIRDKLRIGKDHAGMTLDEISSDTGISRATVCKYFKMPEVMPIQAYRDICRAIGLEVTL